MIYIQDEKKAIVAQVLEEEYGINIDEIALRDLKRLIKLLKIIVE